MIIIYTDCKNKAEAKKIAGMLLKLKLIACANWWPIESIYRWKDKIVNDKEVVLFLKTRKNYYKKVESIIKKLHSYEVPCICHIDVCEAEKKYMEWLMRETRVI